MKRPEDRHAWSAKINAKLVKLERAVFLAGFERAFVETVLRRVQRNHFKRVMPPIAKLSNRTVGYDFLYLRFTIDSIYYFTIDSIYDLRLIRFTIYD